MDLFNKTDLIKSLSFNYGTIVASVPLLERAISLTHGSLQEYYCQHVREERGHDDMLHDDLARLGSEPLIYHSSAEFAGAQYYYLFHDHPAMLLGYMRSMESKCLPLELIDELSVHHGTDLTCLRHHAQHDPQHAEDLTRMIDSLPEDIRSKVLWNEQECRTFMLNVRL